MHLGADLKSTLNGYLKQLDYSTVRDLTELIKFNEDHAEQELPPCASGHPTHVEFESNQNGSSRQPRLPHPDSATER